MKCKACRVAKKKVRSSACTIKLQCEYRERGSDTPCSRCEKLGKRCGEKSRGEKVSVEDGDSELSFSERYVYKTTELSHQLIKTGSDFKLDLGTNIPNFKLLDGFEIDRDAIMNDAVLILERHYRTMDKDQIVSVVRDALSSFGLAPEQKEGSPTPTSTTAPKTPSRNITPEPQ